MEGEAEAERVREMAVRMAEVANEPVNNAQ
jgi:hypothetical protein